MVVSVVEMVSILMGGGGGSSGDCGRSCRGDSGWW